MKHRLKLFAAALSVIAAAAISIHGPAYAADETWAIYRAASRGILYIKIAYKPGILSKYFCHKLASVPVTGMPAGQTA